MIWPTLYFPIFLTDCDFSIKEIYQVLIQAYKRRNFQSWTIRFDPYRPFKKKIIKLRSNCVVLLKTFIQKLYVLNHIVLSSILYEFLRKALFFSLSSSKAVFFSLFTPFEINLNQGEYGLTYIFLFKKMINFCQKHVWFELRLHFHFMFNGSFFHFEIFSTNANYGGQYRFTRILHFNQFLSKTDMVQFELYLQNLSVNLYQETIPFERSCPFKYPQ